jgi:hypothetical protein
MMASQQSLTLWWCLFPGEGADHFTYTSLYGDGRYFFHDCLQPVIPQITQDTWPTIVDTLFRHFFKARQRWYCYLYCLWRQLIIPLWLSATYQQSEPPGRLTKDYWYYIDAHFQDAVEIISFHFCPIITANIPILYTNHNQINCQLPN